MSTLNTMNNPIVLYTHQTAGAVSHFYVGFRDAIAAKEEGERLLNEFRAEPHGFDQFTYEVGVLEGVQ